MEIKISGLFCFVLFVLVFTIQFQCPLYGWDTGVFAVGQMKVKCLFALLGRKEDGVDVGKDTSGRNGDSSEKTVEFLVVLDGKSNVTGDDAALLVVAGGVSGEFENLGAEVFEDGRKVDGGSGSHAGGVLSLSEVSSDTTDGELQTCPGRCGGGLLLTAASFSFSCESIEVGIGRGYWLELCCAM